MTHGGKRRGAGRKPGPRPQDKTAIEAFAKRVVEDAEVQANILTQARAATLPVALLQMLFHYAYGKPREQQLDDQGFLEALVGVMEKYATSPEAHREIRAVITAYTTGGPALRSVA